MKKVLVLLATIALVLPAFALTAFAVETVTVVDDFNGYGGNGQRMARVWTPLDGGDQVATQLLADGKGGHKLKISWNKHTAGWGGIGLTVNKDWSAYEILRVSILEATGDEDSVVFQYTCLQEDGSKTPFNYAINAVETKGTLDMPLKDFECPDWWTGSKERDLKSITSLTISVVTSRGESFTIDDIILVDLDGKATTTASTTTTTMTKTVATTTKITTETDSGSTTGAIGSSSVTSTTGMIDGTTKANDVEDVVAGLSAGIIAAIIAGIVIVVGGGCVAVYFLVIKKRKKV